MKSSVLSSGLLVLCLAAVALGAPATSPTPPPTTVSRACQGFTANFTVDYFEIDDDGTDDYTSGLVQDADHQLDPYIYVPASVYATIMDDLGAQQKGFVYGVPCDDESLSYFPPLVFGIYGQQLSIDPDYYVDTSNPIQGLCEVFIDDSNKSADYVLPNVFQDLICHYEKFNTKSSRLQGTPPTAPSEREAVSRRQHARRLAEFRARGVPRPLNGNKKH
ncbi:hypothetical protein M3Y99_01799100 [Aphelenchoides fujianensis]|nr:hypothetical protein M3Y99_01799100 [Aphelenchoides fujianensis]